jgi:NRPS condensation-like uncharacterized protein
MAGTRAHFDGSTTGLTERSTLVRPVGALERLFFRYSERNPSHFLLVAEFDVVLEAQQLRKALNSVQQRHPLLSVHVEDHPTIRLGFYRAAAVEPIPLTVLDAGHCDWRSMAAVELARPFDHSTAPLMRAALLTGPVSSIVILTFDHSIADGISSVIVLDDLIAGLNGRQLEYLPTPPTIEDLVDNSLNGSSAVATAKPDERMTAPASHRPFDGTPPFLHASTVTEEDTTRLAQRCRAESTTVHAAILVAASRARSQLLGDGFVRALSPIDIRAFTGAQAHCAAYFSGACTGLAPSDGTSFWDQARAMSADVDAARSGVGVVTASRAIRQAMTVGATASTARQVLGEVFAWEVLATNLGRQDLTDTGEIAPSAIWAPIAQTHITGEYVIGIVTYRGCLRMTCVGYSPVTDYLHSVVEILLTASTD